jgi:hypothetical protein
MEESNEMANGFFENWLALGDRAHACNAEVHGSIALDFWWNRALLKDSCR